MENDYNWCFGVSENETYADFNGERDDDSPSIILTIGYFDNLAFLRGMGLFLKVRASHVFQAIWLYDTIWLYAMLLLVKQGTPMFNYGIWYGGWNILGTTTVAITGLENPACCEITCKWVFPKMGVSPKMDGFCERETPIVRNGGWLGG